MITSPKNLLIGFFVYWIISIQRKANKFCCPWIPTFEAVLTDYPKSIGENAPVVTDSKFGAGNKGHFKFRKLFF